MGLSYYTQNDSAWISYKLRYRQQAKVQILTLLSSEPGRILSPFWCTVPLQDVYKCLIIQTMANWVTANVVPKNENVAKNNSNSDNSLTSRRTNGGKNLPKNYNVRKMSQL